MVDLLLLFVLFLSWLVFLKHFPDLRKCVMEMSFDSC